MPFKLYKPAFRASLLPLYQAVDGLRLMSPAERAGVTAAMGMATPMPVSRWSRFAVKGMLHSRARGLLACVDAWLDDDPQWCRPGRFVAAGYLQPWEPIAQWLIERGYTYRERAALWGHRRHRWKDRAREHRVCLGELVLQVYWRAKAGMGPAPEYGWRDPGWAPEGVMWPWAWYGEAPPRPEEAA